MTLRPTASLLVLLALAGCATPPPPPDPEGWHGVALPGKRTTKYEWTVKDGRRVLLRPARASDATGVRDLFFHLPDADIYTRFFRRVRALSAEDVRRLCNYDQENSVGFVAVTGPRDNEVIVGQCCYFVNPSSNTAETAFLVDAAWQGCGLGSAMQRRLAEHAKARGLRGFTAEILPQNARMLALAKAGDGDIVVERDEDSVIVTTLF